MRNAGRLGRSLSVLVSGALVGQLATLAAAPILGRLYSPVEYGVLALYVSVVTIGAVISTLRYEMAIVIPRSAQEALAIRQVALRLLGVGAVATGLVCVITVLLLPQAPAVWLPAAFLAGPGVLLTGFMAVMTLWHTRTRGFAALSRSRAALGVATAVAQVAVSVADLDGGVGLIVGLLIGQAVATLILIAADGRPQPLLSATRRAHALRKHWRMPVMQMPQALIDAARASGITMVIGTFSIAALGQYSQAWRLVTVPSGLVATALSQVYYPELATAGRARLFSIVTSSVLRALAFGFVPFVLIFVFSPVAIPWALGAQWEEAGLIAQALTPWLYLNLATSPISTVFVVLNRQLIGLLFAVAYAVAPIVVLISFHGHLLTGVVAMSACQSVLLIVNLAIVLLMTHRYARTQ